ncbi:Fis family transcriptional regulator [Sphingomonas sp. Leaf17]|uniref:sigma-54-dependent transcriptional regulator n=1 Tax=Sphingomonas sp. Leaf17 TaxID=1735683 RepID=UPI0006F85C4F|nr:sigma-54 dependent transcriptional regulator [Sphingomonas sp. Leaf17]KQM65952.1 Fis family transcriptional regulator [Sphingomonas sp. Leaf17]
MAVALVDDDDDLRDAMRQTLALAGVDVVPFAGAGPALAAIDANFAGVVVTDVRMPRIDGLELFRRLHDRDPDLPVILITGHGDVAMAVNAMHRGAWDFLTKPFDPAVLVAAVQRARAHRSLVLDNRRLRALADDSGTSALIGRSPAIRHLRDTIAILAYADIDVLVQGETGSGKELVARLIHRGGKRARQPFVTIACAAQADTLPNGVIDAHLYARIGEAQRGTLLLDDVDRAAPTLQARLAQIIEDRSIRPVGTGTATPVDVRIVATASPGLEDLAGAGGFDPALLYRLSAVTLRIPPLRDRREDIALLFAHLIDSGAARLRRPPPPLTDAVRRHLIDHDWPGNVRELTHFAERVLLGIDDGDTGPAAPLPDRVDRYERALICEAIVAANGEIGPAIVRLGIPRKTFYYKVQRLGIDLSTLKRR